MKWDMRRQRYVAPVKIWLLAWLAGLLLLGAGQARGQSAGTVVVLSFQAPVTPVLQSYLARAISNAEQSGAAAVVLELDTPGGSLDITQQIMQDMARSTVPVIVYVYPQGAHASSAGTFITLAGHLAAMAPGTTIGAASPVGNQGQDLSATEKAKVTNTLVSDIRNLTTRRGDKAVAWAERAVSEATTATADEALNLGIVDAVAPDLPSLLHQLDGRQVSVAGQTVTLHLSDRPVQRVGMNPVEDFLNTITNPNVAAILLTLGTSGLLLELTMPGTYLPGVAGAICLLLAFYALGVLQANWTGLAFVALAFVLFVVDIKAPTHGLLTLGGIVSFMLGGFILFNTPVLQVPWVTLSLLALSTAAFFAFAIGKALAAQRSRPVTGMGALVGHTAEVRKELAPAGTVFVDGELWQADALEEARVPVGTRVMVTGYEGFRLRVRRIA